KQVATACASSGVISRYRIDRDGAGPCDFDGPASASTSDLVAEPPMADSCNCDLNDLPSDFAISQRLPSRPSKLACRRSANPRLISCASHPLAPAAASLAPIGLPASSMTTTNSPGRSSRP